ncbi:MAG: SURF1 family protein [Aquincola sp.]|nr:SURF1 family protein [Aquincola sp.]MDH4290190.1 SURF1 family protein [Aquincola sp.]MDH5331778.1 SURF1 family protein [Aquincola sp.]
MTPRLRFAIVSAAALVAAVVTARLGLWQLDRAAQKISLQASIDERARLPALSASAALAGRPEDVIQRAVQLVGQWSGAHTVWLDNRQMDGRAGFFVVTPLRLPDGRAVLVQRGWAARDGQERTRLPSLSTPAGVVDVHGRIAPPPARLYEFEPAASGPIRQNLDLDAFARETGLSLVPWSVLQSDPVTPDDGLRRDWPAPQTGVAKHQGYAFQWFGLSTLVVILYVWFQLIQPRRRPAAPNGA